jgi:hypothetical protein
VNLTYAQTEHFKGLKKRRKRGSVSMGFRFGVAPYAEIEQKG